MYYGEFTSWTDVCNEFGIGMKEPTVLFAAYDLPDYDGYSTVVYVKDGKFYYVQGSHCSCYGLEDQWDPEEMPLKVLLHMATEGLGMLNQYSGEFARAMEIVMALGIDDSLTTDELNVAIKIAF